MIEFTGERVVPGQVSDDLWSEHVARYAFARRFTSGRRVLDAGCGTGYGSAQLALSAASVHGIDIAPEAVQYASANYHGARFLTASCTAIPFPESSFDLVVAFEVIEHLTGYRGFLDECARVLSPEGLLIVSSPNKRYYAESRAQTGPNPYHEHEFEPAEFEQELGRAFKNVRLLFQDRIESFAFYAPGIFTADASIGTLGAGIKEDANFLIGVCSRGSLPDLQSFVYVSKASNLLREREQHIRLLEEQLAQTNQWLSETQAERDSLLELFRKQAQELDERHRWALDLAAQLDAKSQRVVDLQEQFVKEQQAATEMAAAYESRLAELEAENRARLEWGLATEARLTADLEARGRELAECVRLLDAAEATVTERTLWAQRTEAARQQLAAQINMIQASRWLKLGRAFKLGPRI